MSKRSDYRASRSRIKKNRERADQRAMAPAQLQLLEQRTLLSSDVMTFDAGDTDPSMLPLYHTEAGMTASVEDNNYDRIRIINGDHSDLDNELFIDHKAYGPITFALENGGEFALTSIELAEGLANVQLTASNGETITLASGVNSLPSNGWSGITSFVASATGSAWLDNITFSVGTAAINDAAETDEDTAVTIDVLANDGVEAGGTLAITSVGMPDFGTAIIDDSGTPLITDDDTIEFTPNPDFNGTATFEYTIADGLGNESTAVVTVEVIRANDPPVVDLNGLTGEGSDGIDYTTQFAGLTAITDTDATLVDIDGGVVGTAVSGEDIFVVNRDGRITKIDSDGNQELIYNGKLIVDARNLAINDATGVIYVVDRGDLFKRSGKVVSFDPNTNTASKVVTGLTSTWGIAVEADGKLVVTDRNRIYRVDPSLAIPALDFVAGSNSRRSFMGIAVEADGNILAVDGSNLYRIHPSNGNVTILASGFSHAVDVAVGPNGDIVVMDDHLDRITRFDPDTLATISVQLLGGGQTRWAIDVNADGDVVSTNQRLKVKKPDSPHRVTVIDASGETVLTQGDNLNINYGIDTTGGEPEFGVDNIASLTVTITNLLDGASESLSADPGMTGITASYDAMNGVLLLEGNNTAANYEAVLRTVKYNNTAAAPNNTDRIISFVANDGLAESQPPAYATVVFNQPPSIDDQSFGNDENLTAVGTVTATDPDAGDTLSYSITGGPDAALFEIDSETGALSFINAPDYESPLDAGGDNIYNVEVTVSDGNGGSDTGNMDISVSNVTATISGTVFVDVNGNGLFDGGTELAIDGVTVDLLDESGVQLDTDVTELGGVYAFTVDDEFGTFRVRETQPSGVDDRAAILGSEGGSVLSLNEMQLTLAGVDASDYDFTESGQRVSSGDTATIGFWQNKHGQKLIKDHGDGLAGWLTDNFSNVFGNTFSDGDGDDGAEVASFFKTEFFKKKLKGTSKVDAQFMAVAFATYFTSSFNSGGDAAADFGFNVTETGIGAKVVNVGSSGQAFNVADNTDMTIMQLLLATTSLTDTNGTMDNDDNGYSHVYDLDGDGTLTDVDKALRAMANLIYTNINEGGDI